MSETNYNKQVEKRQRIKTTTLMVGVDIGSEFNAVALMDKAGEVIGRYPKVYNSRRGFEYFQEIIKETKRQHGLEAVLVGMEPTGHYWRKIAFFGKEEGFDVKFVRTTAVKYQRELDESSSAKSDIRDAVTIANIIREGKYIDTVIEDSVYRQLRTLGRVRERIKRYHTGTQNALRAVIDDYFPELTKVFWSMRSRGLWALLEQSPFPQDVIAMGVKGLGEIIKKSSRRRKKAEEKAYKIYELAEESIGLKNIGIGDRYRLKMSLEELKRSSAQLEDIEVEMKKLLGEIPLAQYLLSIKGVGQLTAAIFFGELGNPEHFKHFKQIVKYAGYDPMERDSGLSIGRRKISKKGRWLLRKTLFFMGMGAIINNKFFRDYYDKKLETKNLCGQKLCKKEAMCAVIIKLIKVISALFRDRRMFAVNVEILAAA